MTFAASFPNFFGMFAFRRAEKVDQVATEQSIKEEVEEDQFRRDFIHEMYIRFPCAINSDLGTQAMMTMYPREF